MGHNILYISYDGMTDPLGQSQVLPYLSGLTKYGYCFTILSFEKRERFIKEGKNIRKICEENNINWCPLFFTSKPPIISKIYDRWRMKRKAFSLHHTYNFKLVHCRSYISSEIGLLMKKKWNIKFLFDMRGFWADEKVDAGTWDITNYFFKKIYLHYKKEEKEFRLHADAIVCLTQTGKDEILKDEIYKNIQIDVIPCCADLQHFDYNRFSVENKSINKKKLNISEEKKVITYLGTIGDWYMIEEMFQLLKTILDKYPEFFILFLTKDNPDEVRIESDKAKIPANNLLVTYASRQEVPEYLSIADCGIYFVRPTYSKKSSSPTKHAEMMGMGIPVICNDIGDTGKIIEATKSGVIVNDFSSQEFNRIASRIPEILLMNNQHIRQSAFEYFDLEKGVEKYLNIYKRLIG